MHRTIGISCGIFKAEIEKLQALGKLSIPFKYLDSSLHIYPQQLEKELQNVIEPDKKTILVYGDCHARMLELENLKHVKRVKGKNCTEILLGSSRHRDLMKQGAFFLLPEWTTRWREIFGDRLGLNEKNAKDLMREVHKKFIYIDTGCNPIPETELKEISEYCGLPYEIIKQDLSHLEESINTRIGEFQNESIYNISRSRAFDFLVVDMIESIMQNASSAIACSESIAQHIRELIGVKTVAVFYVTEESSASELKLLAVLPDRRKQQLNDPNTIKLLESIMASRKIRIIGRDDPDRVNTAIHDLYDIEKIGIIPLRVSGKRIGGILLLDIYDDKNIHVILESINKISGTLALILQNAEMVNQLEDLVEDRTVELKMSKEWAELINQTVPSGIYTVDTNHKITSWNEMCARITGYSDIEMIGKHCSKFTLSPCSENCGIFSSPQGITNIECTIKCKDGSVKTILKSANHLHDVSGKVIGAVETFEDITSRKKLEQDLKDNSHQLALINKILRHDLANNFAVINSSINIYKKSKDERFLQEIKKSTSKSIDLIRNMKELENISNKERQLSQIALKPILRKVENSFTELDFKLVIDDEVVIADNAVESILQNIISNAVNHGKADSIKVWTISDTQSLELYIANNGINIPDKIKDRIFEESFKHGSSGNTGIGLYLVEELMRIYGGSVRVDDYLPQGAVFILKFRSK